MTPVRASATAWWWLELSTRAARAAPAARGRENLCEDLHYLNGAFAEYLRVPARFVARSVYPAATTTLPFDRAALTEPLACVLHGVAACELERRGPSEVVVYGAGPIGLLFVAALTRDGHRVVAADPNPGRLAVARELGASATVTVARGGGAAGTVRAQCADPDGAEVAIECSGRPEAWADALGSVRPGGLVNLFGGCAPGTSVPLDTHAVHYSEITIKGVYHHRPATIRRALGMLAEARFPAAALLSGEAPIPERGVAAAESRHDPLHPSGRKRRGHLWDSRRPAREQPHDHRAESALR